MRTANRKNTFARRYAHWLAIAGLLMAGCNATRNSTPAPCIMEPGIFEAPRGSKERIDLTRLQQQRPAEYMLGPRDVLGIYVEGVLGTSEQAPPVHYSSQEGTPPSLGYPVPVREDGTLALPLVTPIDVTGLTLAETEQRITRAYTVEKQILQPGRDRIIVTLMEPRTYQVLVVREDAGSANEASVRRPGEIAQEIRRRGRSYVVELPAYENDVLHALVKTGGLPGVDAKYQIKILRGQFDPNGLSGAQLPPFPGAVPRSEPTLAPEATEPSTLPRPDRAPNASAPAKGQAPLPPTTKPTEPGLMPLGHREAAFDAHGEPITEGESDSLPGIALASANELSAQKTDSKLTQTLHVVDDEKLADVGTSASEEVKVLSAGAKQVIEPFSLESLTQTPELLDLARQRSPKAITIPLRVGPGDLQIDFTEDDIILDRGDIVLIESRESEVFYTGGLIKGGQFPIPRDYDLDVLGAIAMAGGSVAATAGGTGDLLALAGSYGSILPPTKVTIVRTANGRQETIEVDLRKAMSDSRERILIRPNDFVLLEYRNYELLANIVLNNIRVSATYALNR